MAKKFYLFGVLLVKLLSLFSTKTAALPPNEIVIQQQVYFLKNLITKVHQIHHFENIVLYRTSSTVYAINVTNFLVLRNSQDRDIYMREQVMGRSISNILAKDMWSPEVQKPLMSFVISPWEYVNNSKAIPNLGHILKNKNLAVVLLSDIFDIDLKEFVASSLGACLETKIVFLLIGDEMANLFSPVRAEKLTRFFRWCWSKNILNVLLVLQKNRIEKSLAELEMEIYTYTPFPTPIKLIRLTKQDPKDYFPNRIKNLLGYTFKTPVREDKPLVFKMVDPSTDLETVTGISGKIFMEYVKYVNATFQELKTKDANHSMAATIEYIVDLVRTRRMDISIHPVSGLMPHNFPTSYPISNTNSCVVVPVKQNIFPGLYIPQTLSIKLWLLLLVLFLTFLLAYMLVNYDNYGLTKPWLAFSTTLRGMLNMSVGNMGTSKTITKNSVSFKRKICLHMFLLLTGMVFSQTLIASLSSILSSNLYPEQIESLEDLVKENLSIMMVDYIYEMYKYLDLIPANFSHNLIITDANTVSQHLNKLDTRYAYTVYNEEWKVMQHMQVHLHKPRFKIVSKLCIPNVYLNLPTQFNSPFYYSFQNFILQSQGSGLELKWRNLIYWQIHQANGFKETMPNKPEHEIVFGLQHLTYVFYIYIGGMMAAGVVFLIERNWTYWRRRLQERLFPGLF